MTIKNMSGRVGAVAAAVAIVVVAVGMMVGGCDNGDGNPGNGGGGGGGNIAYDTLHDTRDGKSYRTVKIGAQTWMAENLNYTMDSSWCYKNDTSYCGKYGRLYDWDAAISACPVGWHLPSSTEWENLIQYVGGSTWAGKKLKSKRGWGSDSRVNTDEFGFSALPGGYGGTGDSFGNIVSRGYWWSSTSSIEYGSNYAYRRTMAYEKDNVDEENGFNREGFSVRCLRDN